MICSDVGIEVLSKADLQATGQVDNVEYGAVVAWYVTGQ